jgi:D-alanyl-D-alanine dipeptidase
MARSPVALHVAAALVLAATATKAARAAGSTVPSAASSGHGAARLLPLAAPRGYGPDHLPPVADGDDPLVDAAAVVPGLLVRLAYARPDNITRKPLYPADARCRLRRSVAERLALAAAVLARQNLRLVAWDCARPASAQAALWAVHPHAGSVADPARGSLHERGVAVDLGLADLAGEPVALPTPFDTFGPAAAAAAPLADSAARAHRDALVSAMRGAGFRVNPKEWWHFSRLYGFRWPLARGAP